MGPNGSGKSTLASTLLGSPEYAVTQWPRPLPRRRHHRLGPRRARQGRRVPGLPVPAGGRRRVGAQLLAAGLVGPQGHRPVDARTAAVDHGVDGAPRHGPVLRRPLPERRILRRREEAQRDPADGHPRARHRDPRRDRLRPRHRRAEDRGQRSARGPQGRDPSSACSRSRTTSDCCATCNRIGCTSSSRGASSRAADRSWPNDSKRKATTHGADLIVDDRCREPSSATSRCSTERPASTASRRLPRLRVVVAETTAGPRRDGTAVRDHLRQRAPWRVRAGRRDDRAVRRRRAPPSPGSSAQAPSARSSSPRTSPRRSTSSPTRGAGRTCAKVTSSCSAISSTTPTSCHGSCSSRSGASRCGGSLWRTTSPSISPGSNSWSTGPSSSAFRPCRTCSARSRRCVSIVDAAHAAGAVCLVDAAQRVPHLPTERRRARL